MRMNPLYCTSKTEQQNQIKENDNVLLYGGYGEVEIAQLQKNSQTKFRHGIFQHDEIIGQSYGTRIYDSKTNKWLIPLKPEADILSIALPHKTQVISYPDTALILMLLNAVPGKIIVEAGTGSGSLSFAIAKAIAPSGQLHTFDFHEERHTAARDAFLCYADSSNVVKAYHRDVCENGFLVEGVLNEFTVDGIFLDLPTPWLALGHADRCMKSGGALVAFSPCIEQTQRVCQLLNEKFFYQETKTYEVLLKNWGVRNIFTKQKEPVQNSTDRESNHNPMQKNKDNNYRHYQSPMRSHSAYITVSYKP